MLQELCSLIMYGTKMIKPMRVLGVVVFSTICWGCQLYASGSVGYARFTVNGGEDICVSNDVEVSEIRLSLGVGSQIVGVKIVHSTSKKDMEIEVQLHTGGAAPLVDESLADAIELKDIDLWRATGKYGDVWFGENPTMKGLVDFIAVCRNAPGDYCSRPLTKDGLYGSYSFNKVYLNKWAKMEMEVKALLEGKVFVCP